MSSNSCHPDEAIHLGGNRDTNIFACLLKDGDDALALVRMTYKGKSPISITDSAACVSVLESWMLFPGDDDASELSRWSHIRNATLDNLEKSLNKTASEAREQSQQTVDDSKPKKGLSYIKIKPRPFVPTEFVIMHIESLGKLLRRPLAICQKQAEKISVDALLAGSLLLYMRLCSLRPDGPKACFQVAAEIAKKRCPPPRTKKKYSQHSLEPRHKIVKGVLEDAWATFKPVSHLWAALHAIKGFRFEPKANPLAGVPIPQFLAIASAYVNWAATYKAINKHKTNQLSFLMFKYVGETKTAPYDFNALPNDNLASNVICECMPTSTSAS